MTSCCWRQRRPGGGGTWNGGTERRNGETEKRRNCRQQTSDILFPRNTDRIFRFQTAQFAQSRSQPTNFHLHPPSTRKPQDRPQERRPQTNISQSNKSIKHTNTPAPANQLIEYPPNQTTSRTTTHITTMCYQRKCEKCSKITWGGCGQHIKTALAGVPKSELCTCAPNSSKAAIDNPTVSQNNTCTRN
jgi:hypothetical protein